MYSTENLKTFTIKKADLAVQIPKAKEVLLSASTTGKLAKYLQNIDPQLYLQRILILANSNKKVDFEDWAVSKNPDQLVEVSAEVSTEVSAEVSASFVESFMQQGETCSL